VFIEDVLTGSLRDILGPSTRVRRLIHRSSPRPPRFDLRGILREQRASLNPESKTEDKIKGSPLFELSIGNKKRLSAPLSLGMDRLSCTEGCRGMGSDGQPR
jgi:hypothetical protein